MPRVEFATFGTEPSVKAAVVAAAAEPVQPSAPTLLATPDALFLPDMLRILLVEEDPQTAERISELLHGIFGDRSARDWVGDPRQAAELMQKDLHDVYIIAESSAANGLAEIIPSCSGPVIVLAMQADAGSEASAVAAGAADCIPLDGLTSAAFERSIRHAIIRQENAVRARQRVEALTTEKARLNRLREANHQFVENACHDFRSPLTVIKEFAAIIAEGLAGEVNEEQAEFLEIILTRVDHLSQMVDGILDASRLESDLIGVRREEQPVTKLIEHARPTLEQRAAAHKVAIEFAIPDTLPHVFADTESIGRVIANLGANACKYAGENGKVLVWARYDAEGRNVTIGVTDSGPGIAPEHVNLIFDRFQQIPSDKAQGKDGFGLGLHISSELVRVNFGTLTVESEPQKGSTFTFTLPIFDVNSLIPLHFSFLRTARHGFQKVSIAMVSVAAAADGATLAEVERCLNRQLRSYDLLLRLREGSWLVCAAGDTDELTKITERVHNVYAEISRNRPEGRLPEIRFRPIGTWALSSRPEGLTDAIRGAYALSPEGREIH